DAGRDDRVQRGGRAPVDVVDQGLAVEQVRDGLADAGLAGDRVVHVEDEVLDLGAAALDDLDVLGALGGLLDVGDGLGGQTAVGDVDLAVLHRLLQGALVTAVELQGDARVLGRDGAL